MVADRVAAGKGRGIPGRDGEGEVGPEPWYDRFAAPFLAPAIRAPVDPLELISGTAEAVYGVDEAGRLVVWNGAAERLLGFPADRVLGKPCHEILHGQDVFGNPYCDRGCPLRRMVRRNQAVRSFELDVGRSNGGLVRVSVSILCVPGSRSSGRTILHLLRPVPRASGPADPAPDGHKPSSSRPGAPPAPAGTDPNSRLTGREVEVLRLLAAG
ncbi:MAG: PAS domain-containing protein, partial [Acidobacteria bacterium]|nr:PAS domain-containing protein [Acidobacteriota bacterium]